MSTTPDKAAAEFAQRAVMIAYDSILQNCFSELEEGAKLPNPTKDRIDWITWYQCLHAVDRGRLRAIVQDAVEFAVFRFLVMLDNLSGGPPIEGCVSDYAVYVQVYGSLEERGTDHAVSKVRVNHPNSLWGLHDEFTEIM